MVEEVGEDTMGLRILVETKRKTGSSGLLKSMFLSIKIYQNKYTYSP